jgi:hypothetical protein
MSYRIGGGGLPPALEKWILPLVGESEELSNIIARSLLTAKSNRSVPKVARAREGSI